MITDVTNSTKVIMSAKTVNREKGMGMEVPCIITFTGTKLMLNKLKEVL